MLTATQTREKPILFAGPMVNAIQSGRKTQTRRILNPQPMWSEAEQEHYYRCSEGGWWAPEEFWQDNTPYQVGDLLYVRETWRPEERESDMADGIRYQADDEFIVIEDTRAAADRWLEVHGGIDATNTDRWRPSIHMPKWASRLWLKVTEVRVQWLNDISREDAIAEGVPTEPFAGTLNGQPATIYPTDPIYQFAVLWNRINGVTGPKSWNEDPLVAAYTFKVITK